MTDFESMQADVARLTATVADLLARVAHLEEAVEGGTITGPSPVPAHHLAERHVAEQRLTERHAAPAEPGTAAGADALDGTITYRGTVHAGETALDYEVSHPVATLLSLDEDALARTLAVIAAPPRLTVLRALLEGSRDVGQLRQAVGPVAAGDLDRDLGDLVSAGLILQRRNGTFEAVPDRAIPLLTILAGAHDLVVPQGTS
jgi:DNA-binding transcriptional ArsR family regulator